MYSSMAEGLNRARHLSLTRATSIQSMSLHPTSWRSILMLSSHLSLDLPSGFLPLGFPHQYPECTVDSIIPSLSLEFRMTESDFRRGEKTMLNMIRAVMEWQRMKIHYRSNDENLHTRVPDSTHATWRDNRPTSVWTPPTSQKNNPSQIRGVDSILKQWRMSGRFIVPAVGSLQYTNTITRYCVLRYEFGRFLYSKKKIPMCWSCPCICLSVCLSNLLLVPKTLNRSL